MAQQDSAQFGMIGMAVMGRNLALNMLDHDVSVAAWNLEPELTDSAVADSDGRLRATRSLQELVGALERPRRIMMMIKAGKPVDIVLGQLLDLLDDGDIVIDGGNSWFEDTQRREALAAERGVRFFGVGVSGGSRGARHGPSMMPGGDRESYARIQPVLEAIAATTDSGPCVTYIGPRGAGHFVKMVHNGIEYADMQLIAESYDLLARVGNMDPPALAEAFGRFNEGPLASYLIEITAKIFTVADTDRDSNGDGDGDGNGNAWLVDRVLDQAGQKGTGRWTASVALELGVSIPSIAAAIDARVLSSDKQGRVAASAVLRGPEAAGAGPVSAAAVTATVQSALYAAKIGAYAQGMSLIRAASNEHGWDIDLREVARIWKGGCIIRARMLDDIMTAYERDPALPNLMVDEGFSAQLNERQGAWRALVGLSAARGIPVPAFGAGLAYFDSVRTARLPQNLTQAQRDAFGSHTYARVDAPDAPKVHTDWLA